MSLNFGAMGVTAPAAAAAGSVLTSITMQITAARTERRSVRSEIVIVEDLSGVCATESRVHPTETLESAE
ncbi:hypothetical protein ACUXNS_001232 [Brevibacterium pityocampae]